MAFRTIFKHFDSVYSNYITDINNTTLCPVPTPFKTQFIMIESLTKIKRVYLKSLEMIHGFANIRTGSTDTLKFTLNGTAYGITLAEKH